MMQNLGHLQLHPKMYLMCTIIYSLIIVWNGQTAFVRGLNFKHGKLLIKLLL